MRRLLSWLSPAGLHGQVAGILLLGLALSQVMAALLYTALLPQWQKVLRPELAVTKVAMIVRLLESVPPADRPAFAKLWDEAGFRVTYFADPVADAARGAAGAASDEELRGQIAANLHREGAAVTVHVAAARTKRIDVMLRGGGAIEVIASIGLESRLGYLEQAAIVAFLLFATGGLWAWSTWAVNRPLTRFSSAAERVGLDVHAPVLPEQGPAELKRAIRAFNEMQSRLQLFLSDRTRMLGAISHDLRTPLTRLRLRIETDRAREEKSKMLADIESMEAMLTSTLSFIRGVDDAEVPDIVDLDSLLQTVCDLVSDLGGEVAYAGGGHRRYHCKPQSMMRALTNVVANAAKYGRTALVSLDQPSDRGYLVEIQDDGPGISDAEKSKVFEPFYRTVSARETDSQGMGLGLAIARTIILAHGGTIDLLDRQPCGLCVRIFLPEASNANPPPR